MESGNSEDRFYLLATRVITGEATSKEREVLENWIIKSSAHRDRYMRMCEGWNREPSGASDTSFLFDSEPALEKIWNTIESRSEKTLDSSRQSERVQSTGHRSSSVSRTTVNRLRRVDKSFHRSRFLLAAGLLICAFGIAYAANYFWEQPVEAVYATSDVEQRIITLPDNSMVRLNHNSRVEIQFSEMSGERHVRLQGEAFFDVSHDPDRPFRIHVGESEVRVHGTSFNIKESEDLLVAVREGVISILHEELKPRQGVRLHAGQFGLLSSSGHDLKIEDGDIENYLGWVNGYLNFDDMPFPLVVRQLERIFGIESELVDPELHEIRLSVYADRIQLSDVLRTIAMTLDLTYEREGQVIRWKIDRS